MFEYGRWMVDRAFLIVPAEDNPAWAKAIEGTRRKTLLVAVTLTSVCMAFEKFCALVAEYKVLCVIDASTDRSLARVVQTGAMPIDSDAVLAA